MTTWSPARSVRSRLGGSGNERQLGGAGTDGLTGDDGDDWLEGGAAPDSLTGDTIAPFGVDINTPGEDVLIGGPGTADVYDGGGRMDVFVGESNVAANGTIIPQIDDYLGGLGFDWTTYFGSRTPNADTANFAGALPANDPGLLLDSFIDVEALSGGNFDDTLKGDNRTTLAGITPGHLRRHACWRRGEHRRPGRPARHGGGNRLEQRQHPHRWHRQRPAAGSRWR